MVRFAYQVPILLTSAKRGGDLLLITQMLGD